MAHSFDWPSGTGKGIGTCRLCGVTLRFVTAGPRGGQKREWRTPDGVIHKQGRGALEGEPPCLNGAVGPKATLSYASGVVHEQPWAEHKRSLAELAREVPERFLVALSFSGMEREFVRSIAEAIERRMGPSSVFFDEWYEFYIGGHDADVKLQRIYGTGCELAVVCVSATYGKKAWTKAEHEAIRARLMQARAEEDPRQRDRIFPIRVGDGEVDGVLFNTIASDVRGRTAERVAELVEARLHYVMGSAGPAAANGGIAPVGTSPGSASGAVPAAPPTPAYLNAEVKALSKQLEAARQRQQNLRDAGIGTDEVDREILELRRKRRDGGQLRAGDALGDGRYLLVKPVGRGGFAIVWQAWDHTEQRPVAIKVLHNHLASDPQRRERFFRGARVMMGLQHPAVVRVLDPRGEDESFCYFVMELVPGGNLREAVLGNRVEGVRRLPLIFQVGEALAEAHRKQLVHRDIKPANILLDEQGNAKLTDFDLVGAHDTTGGTRTGALGTVVYAAPECLDKPQDATARADVFGLGMTAIFCLAGRDLSMDTLLDRAGALAELDCTESIRKVLARAVEWKPDRRFADAAEMVGALREALGSSAPTANAAVDESIEQTANAGAGPQADVEVLGVHADVEVLGVHADVEVLEFQTDVEERPTWAVHSGHDRYGLWAAFEVNGVQQRMRWIPAGQFLMGSPETEQGRHVDEGPQHEVTLTRGYWLGETPVTQALWVAVMDMNPSRFVSEDRPVERVSWDDCQMFIGRLNRVLDGLETRLPTEAEWEHACRAGTTAATWVGNLTLHGENNAPELDAIAWYTGNSGVDFELESGQDSSSWPETQHPHTRAGTHPVGRKTPNPYGLRDMFGNVWEWCADGKRRYTPDAVTDPVGDSEGSYRVYHGGSWLSFARYVRAAYRRAYPRGIGNDDLGFRLAGGQASAPSAPEGEPRSGDHGSGVGRDRSQASEPDATTPAPDRERPPPAVSVSAAPPQPISSAAAAYEASGMKGSLTPIRMPQVPADTHAQIEKVKRALKARRHVEIQPRAAQGSAIFAVASEHASHAAEAREYVALVRRADGSHEFECTVTRSEARELLEAGAIFSGHPSRRP